MNKSYSYEPADIRYMVHYYESTENQLVASHMRLKKTVLWYSYLRLMKFQVHCSCTKTSKENPVDILAKYLGYVPESFAIHFASDILARKHQRH